MFEYKLLCHLNYILVVFVKACIEMISWKKRPGVMEAVLNNQESLDK